MDTSLMAAGFEESYIRLWNLKGEPLNGLQSEFQLTNIRDCKPPRDFCALLADCLFTASSLNSLREKGGSPTRKLIGHSGPVYSLAFDPVTGSAAPPKYLLSGSADATARLWSIDTMTNVVAYRGHQNPVWDLDWSPMGIYFTTASRDRTARLWSTDRTSTLRIYAGHSSDVDVSTMKYCRLSQAHRSSASVSILTPCTLLRVRVTGLPDYGMFSGVPPSACSLVTRASFLLSPSAQMADIWPQQVGSSR